MKLATCLGAVVALGLMASAATAQSNNPPTDRDQAAMHHDTMPGHDMRHDHMSMHGRMGNAQMMRWCHSMSHRRMMMNPHCRAMMHRHHRMHHHM
jgi:hypothetical protein